MKLKLDGKKEVDITKQDIKKSNIKAKRDRFKALAERRVNYVIDKLRLIGNLSDKRHYEYTSKDKDKIISAIQKELTNVKTRFYSSSSKKDSGFTLED